MNMNTGNNTNDFGNPMPVEVGPNGCPVGYLENGDKVEWVPDDLQPSEVYPLILLRNDNSIHEAYQEFWDKIWWNRNVARLQQIAPAQESWSESQVDALYQGNPALERIVTKYGRENLSWTDFEWGLLCGRMSALRWVRGTEWEDSLDT